MDIRNFFEKKRKVEEEIDHEKPHCSKQVESHNSIATPSSMATGWSTNIGNVRYGIPSQIGEPIKKTNRKNDYLTYGPSCSFIKQNMEQYDKPFKSEYFETLDILIAELQRRFSDNDDLIDSIASLDELDVHKMVTLKNVGLKIPSREEASVVKAYLSRKEDKMENTLQVLYKQRETFKDTYELFASVASIGCSTAVRESTLSTLTAINRTQRLSMGHERMAGLVFLAFEKKRTKSVDQNEVLRIFNTMANRRIQLFLIFLLLC